MRVLHIFTNPHLTNGATMFEFRISQLLNKDGIYFDYLVTEQVEKEEADLYKSVGSNIFKLPIDNEHGLIIRELKINREYYRFFKNHNYDIVYADTENSLRSIHLFMAKLAGVTTRVVHSHNTGLQTESKFSKVVASVIRYFFVFSATDYFACSDLAAKWLFPDSIIKKGKYKLLTNGVDLNVFKFDESLRMRTRKMYNILPTDVVIGNVGRFVPQKNHKFILSIFNEFVKKMPNAKLMLIGAGPLEGEIREFVKKYNLNESVIFVGTTRNVVNYYHAMDLFLMPSLFEGLPITGIEAQANGLPCLFADSITQELAISNLASYCSLSAPEVVWRDKILELLKIGRRDCSEEIINAGYSIYDTVSYLKNFYSSREKR